MITNFATKILYVSPTYPGPVHEKQICNQHPIQVPDGTYIWQDAGFEGHAPNNAIILQPIKRKKGQEFTQHQKLYNQSIARARVYVEHAISCVKRMHIVKEKIRRMSFEAKDLTFIICCGLHNFRISKRSPRKPPQLYCELEKNHKGNK